MAKLSKTNVKRSFMCNHAVTHVEDLSGILFY
jgi:hypothetical protein